MCFFAIGLFSHAKVAKNVSENFFGVDGTACYFGKVVETLAKVFGYEVAGEILLKGIEGALDVEKGYVKSLLMTDVGDEDFIIVGGRNAVEELLLKPIHALACECLELLRLVVNLDNGLVITQVESWVVSIIIAHENDDLRTFSSPA